MKNLNLKIAGTLALSLLTASTFAQLNWQKGGNNFSPPGSPSTIGTDASWNAPFSIMTNGINRMLINNGGTGNAAGRVAMGNNLPPLFIPQARLHLYQDAPSAIYTKYTAGNTGTNLTDGFDVGYDATSAIQNRQYAEMHNRENTAMKFFI